MTIATTIIVPKPFAEGKPIEWFQLLDIFCTANGLDDEAKAKRLPTGGSVCSVAGTEKSQAEELQDAKAKIIDCMDPMRYKSMDDFHR